jgi:hypothetical protein
MAVPKSVGRTLLDPQPQVGRNVTVVRDARPFNAADRGARLRGEPRVVAPVEAGPWAEERKEVRVGTDGETLCSPKEASTYGDW